MGKRKKNKQSSWVLLHEIYRPMNEVLKQYSRRDVVTLAKLNASGKIMQSKMIPTGMVQFIYDKNRMKQIQIDSSFLSEFDEIITRRHLDVPEYISNNDGKSIVA